MEKTTRRELLVQAGVAAAMVGMAGVGGTAQAAPAAKRKIKKGVCYGMIGVKGSVTDKFKALKEAGFDGVEMDSPSNIPVKEVVAACEATGIIVEGVIDSTHWNITLSDPDPRKRDRALADLKTALHDCKAMGGTSVLLVPAVVNKSVAYDDAWKRSQEVIRRAIPTAEETGVKIACENVWNNFIMSPLEACRYVDEINHPLVGWHFDIGNIVTYGWPEQWVKILGKRIVKLHLKDYSRKKRDNEGLWKGFGVELGEGDVDWAAVMKALDEIGYESWGTAEVSGGDEKRLRFLAQRIDELFAK